ncbi:hypothetical protein QM565_24895 [Geitlerinema splendidum]|nr:hypothetical protein [Geitlerinema splendidum]
MVKNSIGRAKDSVTISNLNQISKAASLYCVDHNDYFPIYVTFHDLFDGVPTNGRGARMWTESLKPYGTTVETWFSPTDPYRHGRNVPPDAPSWPMRSYTSFAHSSSLRSFRMGDYFIYTVNSVPVPSKYKYLCEEGWINVLDERGFGRTLPNNGKDYGCMLMDGSVRRLTWSQLTAKPE